MRRSWKTVVIAVVGAAVLASGAYAIGTQTGGGSADASDSKPSFRAPFDSLAKALGVSGDDLRNALEDFRKQHADQRKDDFAAALAKALGKSTADVEKALQDQKDKARDDFAKRLADALGKSESDVRSALDKVKMGDKTGPRSFFEDLAKELGVSTDRLEQALHDSRPRHFGSDGPFSGLAQSLGVSKEQLRDALRKLFQDHRPDGGARDKELAQFLADRFHLSVDKVEKALQDARPPFPGKGHWHGPRGHWRGAGPVGPPPGGPPPLGGPGPGGPWGGP
jgi:transcriptional regulator with XRE-family HTH domain